MAGVFTPSIGSAQVAGTWIGVGSNTFWTDPANWTSNPQFPSANGTAIFNAGAGSALLNTAIITLQHLKLDTRSQLSISQGKMWFFNESALIETAKSKLNPAGATYFAGHDLTSEISIGSMGLNLSGPGALNLRRVINVSGGNFSLTNGIELGANSSTSFGGATLILNNATLRALSQSGLPTTSLVNPFSPVHVLSGGGTLAGITAPLAFSGSLTGDGPLTFVGPAGVQLSSHISYAGDASIVGGGSAGLTITGAMRSFNTLSVSGTVDASSPLNQDRLGTGTINLRGGTISLNAINSSETIGAVSLVGGHNTIRLAGDSGTFHLSAAQLDRTERATLRVIANGLGSQTASFRSTRIFVDQPGNLPLIGGGGAAGTSDVSIIPFAHAQGALGEYAFVTHDANGLRALDPATEFNQGFPAELTSTANVRTNGSISLTVPRTINSLLHAGSSHTISGTATLSISSGAMMAAGSMTSTISAPVDFGAAEGFISNMKVDGPLHGSNGVTVNGGSTFSSNASTYTGPTTINSGTLTLNLTANVVPGAPGLLGSDTSPIVLAGGVLNVIGSRTFGRDIRVDADSALLRGNEPAIATLGISTFSGAIELNGPLRLDGSTKHITGPITGTGRLIIRSNASLYGNNTFTGGVHVEGGGTFGVYSDQALGSGSIYFGDGTAGAASATMSIGSTLFVTRTLNNPIVVADDFNVRSATGLATGTLHLNGSVDLNGERRSISAFGPVVHFNGPVIGGELQFAGEGTLAGDNSQLATYILASPSLNFSRVTVTHSNGLGGNFARSTQVGDFNAGQNTSLTLRGGIDIPAQSLALYGSTLLNAQGDNVWQGHIFTATGGTLTITDSLTVHDGISGGSNHSTRKNGSGILRASYFNTFWLDVNLGTVQLLANGGNGITSRTQSLSMATGVTIDLTDNAFVFHGTGQPSGLIAKIAEGYANGSWTGTGIQSSTAAADALRRSGIGIALASDLYTTFPATFAGVSVNANATLLRYTLYGDANLDRTVNISDFSILAANFNVPSRWSRGDFNYDNVTTITDFALLAANFNQSLPSNLPRPNIPEPALAGIIALVWFSLKRSRLV